MTRSTNPGGQFRPVPTAVPPSASSCTEIIERSMRSMPSSICRAYPPNSCPRVTGVASIRWVRPDFTTSPNSIDLRRSEAARRRSAGTSTSADVRATARWTDVGKVSLEDCDALTWSFGWTRSEESSSPSSSFATFAMTSLRFMFVDVPEPVWNTSTGNCVACLPSMTSSAARRMASATSAVTTPVSSFAVAAAHLSMACAAMTSAGIGWPETGKFSTARWVLAPHRAPAGIVISPIVSRAMRSGLLIIVPPGSGPRGGTARRQVVVLGRLGDGLASGPLLHGLPLASGRGPSGGSEDRSNVWNRPTRHRHRPPSSVRAAGERSMPRVQRSVRDGVAVSRRS